MLELIQLTLQVRAEDAPAVRALVRRYTDIEVAPIDPTELYTRADVDALILGERIAVEYFLAQPPRTVTVVDLDAAKHVGVLVYGATVTLASRPAAPLKVAAAWIVAFPSYAAPSAADSFPDMPPEQRIISSQAIEARVADYPLILNALEVMARQNAGGVTPLIRRAALMCDLARAPSALQAYDIYRARVLEGAYGDQAHPEARDQQTHG